MMLGDSETDDAGELLEVSVEDSLTVEPIPSTEEGILCSVTALLL